METRALRPWEMLDLVPLARNFHEAAKLGGEFDDMVFRQTLSGLSATKRLGTFGMFQDGKLVGCLIGMVSQHFLCREVLAQELMWWVEPDFRANSGAIRLVKLFEEWAKGLGVFGIVMASFAETDGQDRLSAIYSKLGYREIEKHFFKHV